MTREELEKMDELELDELVHTAKLEEGSGINNGGKAEQIAYLMGEDTTHARADACILIRLVFDAAIDGTDSFEEDSIGTDLAYLMGAIAKNSFVEWERAELPVLHSILEAAFPSKEHPVWSYIAIFDEEATAEPAT